MKHAHDHSHPATPEHPEGVRHSHFHTHDEEIGELVRDTEFRQAHKAGLHEHEHRTRQVTLEITFDVGALEDIGLGGFKTGWLDTEQDDREFSLTAGAGCGSPYLEAHVSGGGQPAVYAQADIRTLTGQLWDALREEQARMAVLEHVTEAEEHLASGAPMTTLDAVVPEQDVPDENGVHAAHCCRQHGCKYGDAGCPVARGTVKQDYPCEFCEEEER
jgi:hypothetical protein